MEINEAMAFKDSQELANIGSNNFAADFKLLADFPGYLFFAVALFEEFQNPRTNEIEAVHPAFGDMQNNCSVTAMGGAHLIGNFQHGGLRGRLCFENAMSVAEEPEVRPLVAQTIRELALSPEKTCCFEGIPVATSEGVNRRAHSAFCSIGSA